MTSSSVLRASSLFASLVSTPRDNHRRRSGFRSRRSAATCVLSRSTAIRRVYLEDVLACPCGGRRRLVTDIGQRAQREAIVALLTHLGIRTEPPPIARARG
jgi:hypothetical protein